MQSSRCLNCEAGLEPGQKFCPQCGQRVHVHRLSLHEVGHDFLHYFTHADKGIFQLVKELVIHPGKTAREYVKGKRRKYFPPLNFFLIVAALGLAVTGISHKLRSTGSPERQQPAQVQRAQTPAYDPVKTARYVHLGRFFEKYYNIVPVIATPLLSLLIWLFYFRSGYNYTEHLVANMYIVGFTLLVYAVAGLPLVSWLGRNALLIPYFIFEVTYRALSYYYFINRRTLPALLYSIGVNVLLVGGWAFFTKWLIAEYISSGFWGLLA